METLHFTKEKNRSVIINAMETDFSTWLTGEMDKRGWNNSELARRAGLVPSTISMVISQQKNPGLDFCVGIALAFRLPPEIVLRKAGLLDPEMPQAQIDKEAAHLFAQLPDNQKEIVLAQLRGMIQAAPQLKPQKATQRG